MSDGNTYFKKEKGSIYLTAQYCEFYIPMEFFSKSKFAQETGFTIHTIGIFDVAFFENGSVIDRKVMKIPTWVNIYVQEAEERKVVLPHSDEPVACKVLKYNKGAKVMDANYIKNSDNALTYLDFVTKGKLPKSIPYNALLSLWWKNQIMNDVNLGVPSVILEMILAVSYRDMTNPTLKFATVIGKNPSVSQFAYKTANIREVSMYASTFTALTFEDFDAMVTASLNRSREKKHEAESPVEALIKY